MDGYVVTKEKHFVNSGTGNDIIVDDRNEFLNESKAAMCFRIKTPYHQTVELIKPVHEINNLSEISNILF
jgi:hypothetical protein